MTQINYTIDPNITGSIIIPDVMVDYAGKYGLSILSRILSNENINDDDKYELARVGFYDFNVRKKITMNDVENIFKECSLTGTKELGIDYIDFPDDKQFDTFKYYEKYGIIPKKYVHTFNEYVHGAVRTDSQNFDIIKYIKATEKFGLYHDLVLKYMRCANRDKDRLERVIIAIYNSKHKINIDFIHKLYHTVTGKNRFNAPGKLFNYKERKNIYMRHMSEFTNYGIARMFDFYEKYPFNLDEISVNDAEELLRGANAMRAKLIKHIGILMNAGLYDVKIVCDT